MGEGLVKTLWSLEVLSLKLSSERLLLDPQGFMHDAQHAANTLLTTIDYLAHDKKQFVSNLLNLNELRTNPIHWAGELVPSIVVTLLSFGAGGIVAKGGEVSDTIDATAQAADSASKGTTLSARVIDHITNGYFSDSTGKPVGFHSAPGGVVPEGRRIDEIISVNNNGTYRAEVSFQQSDGTWISKNVPIHTMFPDLWSGPEVTHAVEQAFNNHSVLPNGMWEGSYDGVTIRGYMNDGVPVTAFPAPEQ